MNRGGGRPGRGPVRQQERRRDYRRTDYEDIGLDGVDRELAEMNECDKRRYCGEKVPKPSLYNSIALKSLNRDLAKE